MATTLRDLWPQFLGSPAGIGPSGFVECVEVPTGPGGVAEICLLDRLGHNDDEAEVLARDGIMEIVHLGAQFKVLVFMRLTCRPSRRRRSERAYKPRQI